MAEHLSAAGKNKKMLWIVLLMTGGYLMVEVIGGIATGSLALLADAGHMLTDVAGLVLALFAIKIGERAANSKKSYGYYRAEILAATANAIILIGVSFYILYEAYQRFLDPPKVSTVAMSGIAFVGLIVNLVGMKLLQKASGESLNMKGAYFEVMSDLLTSIGVLVAGGIMWVTGWYYADPIISAGIGLFILPRTWVLLKDAIGVLLEGTPSDLDLNQVRKSLQSVSGVLEVHDLHAWALTTGMNALSVHIVKDPGKKLNEILGVVHKILRENYPLEHLTVQVEDQGFSESETHL